MDVISKVHCCIISNKTLLKLSCINKRIRVPLYVVKVQLMPMVSDMLEFNFEKVAVIWLFSLKSATFVAVMTKVIANEIKV